MHGWNVEIREHADYDVRDDRKLCCLADTMQPTLVAIGDADTVVATGNPYLLACYGELGSGASKQVIACSARVSRVCRSGRPTTLWTSGFMSTHNVATCRTNE